MKGKEELVNFKKMWTWLVAYPAHDREYYMKHVAKLDEVWGNSCPLSNNMYAENCNGCQMLWDSQDGTLCTDPSAPVYKWNNTERDLPDKRSFYASQIAVLAMKVNRQLERQAESCVLRRKAA
jgi:hypothetical protein